MRLSGVFFDISHGLWYFQQLRRFGYLHGTLIWTPQRINHVSITYVGGAWWHPMTSDRPDDLSFLREMGFMKGDPNLLRDAILYLAAKCGYVYPVKIAKLLYLAELEHINRVGKRLTSAEFLSDNYGPNPREAGIVVDFLEMDGWLQSGVETTKRGYVMTKIRLAKSLPKLGLSEDATETLDLIVRSWKFRNTDAIVAASKATEPFKETPKGALIDLHDYLTARNLRKQGSPRTACRE